MGKGDVFMKLREECRKWLTRADAKKKKIELISITKEQEGMFQMNACISLVD